MNKRIKELVDQILPNEKEWHKGDPKDWGYFFSGNELEKFAELLISAVMTEVKDEVQFQCGWANAEIVENRVKKEFGV
jgi:hypothetical protein